MRCCPNSLAQRTTGSAAAAAKPKYSPSFLLWKGPKLASEDSQMSPGRRARPQMAPGHGRPPGAAGSQAALALAAAPARQPPRRPGRSSPLGSTQQRVPSPLHAPLSSPALPCPRTAGQSALRPLGWCSRLQEVVQGKPRLPSEKGFPGVWGPGEQVFISRAAPAVSLAAKGGPTLGATAGPRAGLQASKWEVGEPWTQH